MNKPCIKALMIINLVSVLLFAVYLVSLIFIDYPKLIKSIVLSVYLVICVLRACCYMYIKNSQIEK